MKLLYLSIIAFFITFVTNAQVTVTMNNIKTDNVPINNNTISFNSNPSINLSLDVQLLTSDNSSNNTFGNLFFYYKPSANEAPVQVGFQAITFVQNFPLLNYVSNVSYTNILLNKANFLASGGFFYCEYNNNNKQIFKSSSIPITITNTTPTPTPIPTPTPVVTLSTNVKYSDNLPILDKKIFIPKNSSRSVSVSLALTSKEINSNGKISLTTYKKRANDNNISDEISRTELKSFTINDNNIILNIEIDANLVPTDQTKSYSLDFYVNNSLYNLGNVIASDPIINNIISDNQLLTIGTRSNPITGSTPYKIIDTRNFISITKYQWQQKILNSDWTNITGATSQNYTPTNIFLQTTSFRRIVADDSGLYSISEYITISTITPPLNNICCNQTLKSTTDQPTPFNGNTLNSSYLYQWQISEDPLSWKNITNATSSSLTYIFPKRGGRGREGASFRRLVIQNDVIVGVSNTIDVTGRGGITQATTTSRSKLKINDENNKDIILLINETINIYPNPITDYFYIQNIKISTRTNKIKVFDMSGKEIKISKIVLSDDLVQINVPLLPSGIYFVQIDENDLTLKKIIKK